MLIEKIKIYGLKGIEKKELSFSDKVLISGRNESGKTTVKDAILFALFGRVDNTTQFDGAINKNSNEIRVIIELKHRKKSYIISRSKNNNSQIISINGINSSQEQLEQMLGIDYHGFLSAVCVGDFMKLENLEKRKFLLSLFNSSDRTELWKELTGETDVPDLSDITALHKRYKAEYNNIDSDIKFNTQKKSFIQSDIANLKENIQDLPEEITSIQLSEADVAVQNINKTEPTLSDYLGQAKEADSTEEIAIRTKITELSTKRNSLIPPSMEDFDKLKGKHAEKNATMQRLKDSMICPTCKREFNNKAEKEREIQTISREIINLQTEGKEVLAEYNVLKKAYDDAVALLETNIAEQNNKLAKQAVDKKDRLEDIENAYKTDHETWRMEFDSVKKDLDDIRDKYNTYIRIKSSNESAQKMLSEKETELSDLEKKLESLSIDDIKKKMDATGPKGIEYKELLSKQSQIAELVPDNFVFEFIKKNKTNDGFKQVFNLLVDGIEYDWLSTGKKIAVDYILSGLINTKLDYDLAMVDNIESLTSNEVDSHDVKSRGQLISFKAIDADFSLDSLS